jgi:hypothetical protein
MIPVDQEFFYDTDEINDGSKIGDCVRAVTASILELSIKEVPHFVKDQPGSDWYDTWEKFMIDRGITPILLAGPWVVTPKPVGYYLASGPVKRGGKHIVIMWDGKVAHDPHPSRAGLESIEGIWILK